MELCQRRSVDWLLFVNSALLSFRLCTLLTYDRYIQFDAVRLSHLVDAEYGNQGIDFKMVPREGFGWMNGKGEPSNLAKHVLMQ